MLLGVGCDIVETARIKRAMEEESLLHALNEQERKLSGRIPKKRRAEWLAGYFVVKEAVIKVVYKEKSYVPSAVEILADAASAPTCHTADLQVEVSISHEKGCAIAHVAVMKEQVFMYILRSLYFLWLTPRSWIDTTPVRKEPSAQQYARMRKWSERLLSHYRVILDIQLQEQLPEDQPILFVCNHQSEFDMPLQMAVPNLPFIFISKKENEKVSYVVAWSKTLEVVLFDREDHGSAIHMLREAVRRFKVKDNLLIFPEGARSKGGVMHPMQAGSMQLTFTTKACIVPIVLKNPYDYMDVMKYKGTFRTHILKPPCHEDCKPLKAEGVTVQLQEEMQRVLDEA